MHQWILLIFDFEEYLHLATLVHGDVQEVLQSRCELCVDKICPFLRHHYMAEDMDRRTLAPGSDEHEDIREREAVMM